MFATALFLGFLATFDSGSQVDRGSKRVQQLSEAINYVAVDIMKDLPKQGNTVFSPPNLVTVLGMLYAGARGSTAREMREALSFNKVDLLDTDVGPAFSELSSELLERSANYTLYTANSVLIQTGFPVLQEYRNTLEKYYHPQLQEADFQTQGQATMEQVNHWVDNQTGGKISKLLQKPLSTSTKLLLLNAIYFKGKWERAFNPKSTKQAVFYNNGRDEKYVPTMFSASDAIYGYSSELKSKLLELPYMGNNLSMVFILPGERDGLNELEREMTKERLLRAIRYTRKVKDVRIQIPKFKVEKTHDDLKNVLKEIGIHEAFYIRANLTGIVTGRKLKVDDVIQKCIVEVNEEGSEAAAGSGVHVRGSPRSSPRSTTFIADHPFLFVIRDRRTGLILFLGRVNELM